MNDSHGFAEWCSDNGWVYLRGRRIWYHEMFKDEQNTTDQLYELYKKHQHERESSPRKS